MVPSSSSSSAELSVKKPGCTSKPPGCRFGREGAPSLDANQHECVCARVRRRGWVCEEGRRNGRDGRESGGRRWGGGQQTGGGGEGGGEGGLPEMICVSRWWRGAERGRREEVSVKVEVERGGCCLSGWARGNESESRAQREEEEEEEERRKREGGREGR